MPIRNSMRPRRALLVASMLALGLSAPQGSQAAATITSLIYYHVAIPNCEDTVNGSPCFRIEERVGSAVSDQA